MVVVSVRPLGFLGGQRMGEEATMLDGGAKGTRDSVSKTTICDGKNKCL